MAAFFLMFFKAAAIFIYIFCGWFGTDFVINFCVITFLLVCDFWTVRGCLLALLVRCRQSERFCSTPSPLLCTVRKPSPAGSSGRQFWPHLQCVRFHPRPAAGQECVWAAHGGAAQVRVTSLNVLPSCLLANR